MKTLVDLWVGLLWVVGCGLWLGGRRDSLIRDSNVLTAPHSKIGSPSKKKNGREVDKEQLWLVKVGGCFFYYTEIEACSSSIIIQSGCCCMARILAISHDLLAITSSYIEK